MRRVLVLIHRWLGLGMALFLFQAGLTGALIAWDQELDGLLNPELYRAEVPAGVELLPPLRLAERVEEADARLQVTFLPLAAERGRALLLSVGPRLDPDTGKPYELDFDQVAVNPATGEIQGRRQWGKASLSRQQVMPFLYKLHYSLHLPSVSGLDLGIWFMGIVAMVWLADAFIALWISFPSRKAWQKSFAFRFDKGGYRLNFDLHRSGGVWTWLLLVPLAFTAISMNLNRELVRPLVSLFSPLAESPFAVPSQRGEGALPGASRERVLSLAGGDAERLGLERPLGGIFYSPAFDVYGVGFYEPGKDRGDGGLGNPWLYYDGQSAAPVGADLPGAGSAGDIFLQLQFPVHSGRILGVPGRVLVTLLGLVVATLSVTGIVIWARKRKARMEARAEDRSPAGARDPHTEPASIRPQPST